MSDKNQEKKILANLIKEDLKDALVNVNRWERKGLHYFFHEYWNWSWKPEVKKGECPEIWITNIKNKNEELKKALVANCLRHQVKREAVRKMKLKNLEHENGIVKQDELDPADWTEIVNLIEQVEAKKYEFDGERKQKINEKLNSKKGLVYWEGQGVASWQWSGRRSEYREWYMFYAVENGKEYLLNIPKNHAVLANFPFDQEGFYLVETVDYNTNTKNNGCWTAKDVNLTEELIITPYHDAETVNFDFKNNAERNKKYEENRTKNASRENSGNNNLTISEKSSENSDLAQIKNYFLKHNIKEITFENGELKITNNDNKTMLAQFTTTNPDYLKLAEWCQKHNQTSLSRETLGIDNNNNQNYKDNSKIKPEYLWIGGIITVGIVVLAIFLLRSRVKKHKNN